MKVVILCHGHPTFSKGGGELAAYYLWQGIDRLPDHQAWFIGRGQPEIMHKFTTLAAVGERDYLLAGNSGITDLTSTTDLGSDSDLAQLLGRIQPDVLHFHHYVHIGIDTIRLVKNVCPRARIVVTLHEYIAICQNNGQMIKTDGRLCHQYSPRECHLCFPHLTPENIFLREQYIKSFFRLVDIFISPSEFLRERYIAWGIEPERITVIENGLPEGDKVPPRPLQSREVRGRFAYFGQINPYKGVDVILEAFARLPKKTKKQVTLDIFGSALKNQTPEFQEKIAGLLAKCNDMVRLHGPYEPEEMPRLMADVDWVIMGSVWWENSPLVIQEAFKFGRPLITPDIGGMAEKVRPGEGGVQFRVGDAVSLASRIEGVVSDPEAYEQLLKALPDYPHISDAVVHHLSLYSATEQEART
jgi:glycosyltransferase involved in cell wall biosynthesis